MPDCGQDQASSLREGRWRGADEKNLKGRITVFEIRGAVWCGSFSRYDKEKYTNTPDTRKGGL